MKEKVPEPTSNIEKTPSPKLREKPSQQNTKKSDEGEEAFDLGDEAEGGNYSFQEDMVSSRSLNSKNSNRSKKSFVKSNNGSLGQSSSFSKKNNRRRRKR